MARAVISDLLGQSSWPELIFHAQLAMWDEIHCRKRRTHHVAYVRDQRSVEIPVRDDELIPKPYFMRSAKGVRVTRHGFTFDS